MQSRSLSNSAIATTVSGMEFAKMLLLRKSFSPVQQQRFSEPIRSVQKSLLLGRSNAHSDATGSTTSERIRGCCRAGPPLRAVREFGTSTTLHFSANVNSPEPSGKFHECSSYSGVKANRSSSHLCRILSSAVEAHDLTQLAVGPPPIHDHSDPEPLQNDEAEGDFKLPVGNLRALLRLWDTDNNENEYCELLVVTDCLERLGLDLHFREEIKFILDRVFRIWTENTVSETAILLGDLGSVALAFFLLRSHQYDVQPRIFQLYRKEDGSFCKTPQLQAMGDYGEPNATSADVTDLLNLLRASDLKFRCDADLQDAYNFASTTLRTLLDGPAEPPLSEKTSAEIRYRLKYPWAVNLRLLETRQTVLNFQIQNFTTSLSSDRLSSTVLSLMLTTATQLLNHYISRFQREIEDLYRWFEDSGLSEKEFRINDLNLLICYLSIAYEMPQAKYAHTREVHAKTGFLLIVIDDYYEFASSMEDLAVFNEAWRKWNPSLLEKLPKDPVSMSLRIIYKEMYSLTTSWAEHFLIWHGRDLLETFILTWAVRMEVYFEERQWVETGYKFNLDEYVNEYAKWSFGVETVLPLTYYSLGGKVSRSFAETRPDMETLFGISKTARFLNDAKTYLHERTEGKGKTNMISLLMEENPLLTEKDAVDQTEKLAQLALQETTESFLRCGWPSHELKSIVHQSFRGCTLVYTFVDGLRSENWVLGKLMKPLPDFTRQMKPREAVQSNTPTIPHELHTV